MNEQSIASARASVMVYDDTSKKWIPSGSSSGLSKVHIFQNLSNNTFRVVARKLNDHEVVINCIILKGLKYNQATYTFHQWRDNKQVYGLNFSSREDADSFARAMTRALDVLNSNSLPRPPTQPITQQAQTHYQQANGQYDEDMGYSPMIQRQPIYHQVSPGGPTRIEVSPGAQQTRSMTREDVAMIQERRMSQQSQRNNTMPRMKDDLMGCQRKHIMTAFYPFAHPETQTHFGFQDDASDLSNSSAVPVCQDVSNNGSASSPSGGTVPPTPPGHHRTSSAPPAPAPPPMTLAPPPPPAPPAAPPCPPPAPMMVVSSTTPGVVIPPAPVIPGGGIGGGAGAPPPPPPPPQPNMSRSSSNDGNDVSSLAAQLQNARLRRSNKQSAENSGSSTSSSGSNYGTLGRGGTGMASMMDEMAKTLARRRAAAERKEVEPSPQESDYGTAERNKGLGSKMGNGCEASPKNSRRALASSEESLPKVNGDSGVSELEAIKQDILREMRREMNKMKTEIIEALKTELNRR